MTNTGAHAAVLMACALSLLASTVRAADAATPEARWNAVAACANGHDERERHACVDEVLRKAGVLTTQQDARDQRARFGNEPARTPDAAEPDTVQVKIAAVSESRDGHYSFTTEDGAVWRQIESKVFALTPQPGQTLTIQKALLGSFFCQVNGKAPFRCSRSR